MPRLFVHGFPGLYGGAATELHHQIKCWRHMGVEVHIIPTMQGSQNEPLRQEMIDLGVIIHGFNEFGVIQKEDAIINFCSKEFLVNLPEIVKYTRRTVFVNCMTWLFQDYKQNPQNQLQNHLEGNIAFELFQRPQIRDMHMRELRAKTRTKAQFIHFQPYFDATNFPFLERNNERFTLGRISRQDADKFHKDQWHIWEGIHSPLWKRGLVLGWDSRSASKCGPPLSWVETYSDHNALSVADFWRQVDALVQITDTNENWPRVGFEAMYSGVPLVVDKRAGWTHMVDHGVTGFLCDHARDFMYYGSKLAYEPEFRLEMAKRAKEHAIQLSGMEAASQSWKNTLERIFA